MSYMTHHKARQVLGIAAGTSASDIRIAWKRAVRAHHPDRKGGCARRLLEANEAYEVLTAPHPTGGCAKDAVRPRGEPRPDQQMRRQSRAKSAAVKRDKRGQGRASEEKPRPRRVALDAAKRGACHAKLARDMRGRDWSEILRQNGGCYVDPRAPRRATSLRKTHIASAIRVVDRVVSITVPGEMQPGSNLVAVPQGTREADRPTVLAFTVKTPGQGRIRLPAAIVRERFPWADAVELTFGA